MRITGGSGAGIRLETPGVRDQKTRPATDRLREAIFSSLGTDLQSSTVLDLFAGTGSYGLEALSRGASHLTFVEKNRKNTALIQRNKAALENSFSLQAESRIFTANACESGPWLDRPYDFVFIDPPYEIYPRITKQLETLCKLMLATNPQTMFCMEMPGNRESTDLQLQEIKRFGKKQSGPSMRLFVSHA